jgi:tRNA U34 2-thiouridine synthase MnmA/TrmU
MSQRKATMPIIAKESGAEERLLRPLCAKNLPITLPEREGWINRDLLHDFSGRSRKPQIELARSFQFDDYAQPAGGCCFLTDEQYSKKLIDLWQNRGHKEYELDDILLLKVGRHLRPNSRFKIIIAREEGEANFLKGYQNSFIYLHSHSHHGPLALIDGNPTDEDLKLAARLVARYSQGRIENTVEISLHLRNDEVSYLSVSPFLADEIPLEWFI